MARESAHGLRDAARPAGFDHADGEAAKPSDIFWAVAGTDAAAVLIIVPIENIMATVLDGPLPAVDLEHALRGGLLWGPTGEAIGDFQRIFPRLFLGQVSLDEEGLAHVREVQIVVEFRGGPDFARFQAAVIGGRVLDEMRGAPIPEVKLQVFEKSGLVALDGEIVVRLALPDQIVGEGALGEQGIGRDVLARDVEGRQQGDSRLDLVRALGFFPAFYG